MATVTESDAVMETLRKVLETSNAATVFGEPVTNDGATVIPVAKVSGGGGGGSGTAPAKGENPTGESGTGGGIGMSAKPVGVFVIKDGKATWRPAVDVNKIILGGQIVAVVALLTIRAIVRYRSRRTC